MKRSIALAERTVERVAKGAAKRRVKNVECRNEREAKQRRVVPSEPPSELQSKLPSEPPSKLRGGAPRASSGPPELVVSSTPSGRSREVSSDASVGQASHRANILRDSRARQASH